MYALIDCNNFYCSVERVFEPSLHGRAIVVLSNNDGCVISRSEEAKKAGIIMGTPAHLIGNLFKQHNVAVFSSNYTLYGDMSDRVMKTIASFVPGLEVYSIDEAFVDLHNLGSADLLALGIGIRQTVLKHTGIPVSVGIGATKTLAKMANAYAKKHQREAGAYWAANAKLVDTMLSNTDVGDVWGIGHRYSLLLKKHGFNTASELCKAPDDWLRENLSVVGLRLVNELRGIPCLKWETTTPVKKNICTSRSFGRLARDIGLLQEAISNYAAACAEKLRRQHSCCTRMNIFISTNPHKAADAQYSGSIDIELERASNNSAQLIRYALRGLHVIFREGYAFMKCGVIVQNLVPEDNVQASMFEDANLEKNKTAMEAMDRVNRALGKETVRMATQGFAKRYRLRADHLSRKYTTDVNQLLQVKN